MPHYTVTNPQDSTANGELYVEKGFQALPLPADTATRNVTEISDAENAQLNAAIAALTADARNPSEVLRLQFGPLVLFTEPDTRPMFQVSIPNPPPLPTATSLSGTTLPILVRDQAAEIRINVSNDPSYAQSLPVLFDGPNRKFIAFTFATGSAKRVDVKFEQSGEYVLRSTAEYKIENAPVTLPVVE